MIARPAVKEIRNYLQTNGWTERIEKWRNASIWTNVDGHEVLLPPTDNLGDSDLRIREVMQVLASAEERSVLDVASDISSPPADTQLYRTYPEGLPSGNTTLTAGLQALQSVREILDAVARAVVDGPSPAFQRAAPNPVGSLLRATRLGLTQPGSYTFAVKIPLSIPTDSSVPGPRRATTADPPLGRLVSQQLHDAAAAVRTAAESSSLRHLEPFAETVAAGVSANFCKALSGLAGHQRLSPFDVEFRWAGGLPADPLASTVQFPAQMGRVLYSAAGYLRRLVITGPASVTGYVEGLYDDPSGADRWRMLVRGELTTERGTASRRTIWVRLTSQSTYDDAMEAHRTRRKVRAAGELSNGNGRLELFVSYAGIEFADSGP